MLVILHGQFGDQRDGTLQLLLGVRVKLGVRVRLLLFDPNSLTFYGGYRHLSLSPLNLPQLSSQTGESRPLLTPP